MIAIIASLVVFLPLGFLAGLKGWRTWQEHQRLKNLPPTPAETLVRARDISRTEGLCHVYTGNLSLADSENTYCPACKQLLIERRGFSVLTNNIKYGKCPCGKELYGIWQ